MKIVSKFHSPIFYTFREISHQRAIRSGRASSYRAGSLFWMIQLLLEWSKNFISILSDYFQRFWSCLNFDEATHIWLLRGTSFASLTRNDHIRVINDYLSSDHWFSETIHWSPSKTRFYYKHVDSPRRIADTTWRLLDTSILRQI